MKKIFAAALVASLTTCPVLAAKKQVRFAEEKNEVITIPARGQEKVSHAHTQEEKVEMRNKMHKIRKVMVGCCLGLIMCVIVIAMPKQELARIAIIHGPEIIRATRRQ